MVAKAVKLLTDQPVTSPAFLGLIGAALGSHGQSSYQILTNNLVEIKRWVMW